MQRLLRRRPRQQPELRVISVTKRNRRSFCGAPVANQCDIVAPNVKNKLGGLVVKRVVVRTKKCVP